MKTTPELVVMLTKDDKTVKNAASLFAELRDSRAACFGFKEKPLPLEEMKQLIGEMKACGKTTFFEVVEYTEPECLEGARAGYECGCDVLMGTVFFDSVNDFCKEHGMKYMPFVGIVTERPSVLNGTADDMIREAEEYLAKGVYGFDLLGYRYTGNAYDLIRRFTKEVGAPVCVAGSVDSFERLGELKEISPRYFTVGSAFFDGKFPGSFKEQIDAVCGFMER